jgi:hypothetical protein
MIYSSRLFLLISLARGHTDTGKQNEEEAGGFGGVVVLPSVHRGAVEEDVARLHHLGLAAVQK